MVSFNTFITLSSEELDNLLYRENSYKHDGLYLSQCEPISEGSSQEGKYHVCYYKDVTILEIAHSLRSQFPIMNTLTSREGFRGYNGGDPYDGLVTYWVPSDDKKNQPSGRYTSFYDGAEEIRKHLGMFIDYMNYLLDEKVPESEWLAEKTKLTYLSTISSHCLYCTSKEYDYDPLLSIPEIIMDAMGILALFNPDTKV
jgi:hypothetical protein